LRELAKARAWLLETDWKEGRERRALKSKEGGLAEGSSDLSSVERYLMELIMGEPHEASCKGASSFCKQHQQLFGGVEFKRGTCENGCCQIGPTDAREAGGKRGRQKPEGPSCSERVSKRSKTFWAKRESGQLAKTGALQAEGKEVVPAHAAPQALGGGDGRDAMSGVTRGCTSCVCPAFACPHETGSPLWAPVLPLDANGVQLELPKLVRPTDNFEVHDPLVTSLRRPMRVSELVPRDFEELSAAGCLTAPCPKPKARAGSLWHRVASVDAECVCALTAVVARGR
jgi:hypothetical protein